MALSYSSINELSDKDLADALYSAQTRLDEGDPEKAIVGGLMFDWHLQLPAAKRLYNIAYKMRYEHLIKL